MLYTSSSSNGWLGRLSLACGPSLRALFIVSLFSSGSVTPASAGCVPETQCFCIGFDKASCALVLAEVVAVDESTARIRLTREPYFSPAPLHNGDDVEASNVESRTESTHLSNGDSGLFWLSVGLEAGTQNTIMHFLLEAGGELQCRFLKSDPPTADQVASAVLSVNCDSALEDVGLSAACDDTVEDSGCGCTTRH